MKLGWKFDENFFVTVNKVNSLFSVNIISRYKPRREGHPFYMMANFRSKVAFIANEIRDCPLYGYVSRLYNPYGFPQALTPAHRNFI